MKAHIQGIGENNPAIVEIYYGPLPFTSVPPSRLPPLPPAMDPCHAPVCPPSPPFTPAMDPCNAPVCPPPLIFSFLYPLPWIPTMRQCAPPPIPLPSPPFTPAMDPCHAPVCPPPFSLLTLAIDPCHAPMCPPPPIFSLLYPLPWIPAMRQCAPSLLPPYPCHRSLPYANVPPLPLSSPSFTPCHGSLPCASVPPPFSLLTLEIDPCHAPMCPPPPPFSLLCPLPWITAMRQCTPLPYPSFAPYHRSLLCTSVPLLPPLSPTIDPCYAPVCPPPFPSFTPCHRSLPCTSVPPLPSLLPPLPSAMDSCHAPVFPPPPQFSLFYPLPWIPAMRQLCPNPPPPPRPLPLPSPSSTPCHALGW